MGNDRLVGLKLRLCCGISCGEFELVLLVRAGERAGSETKTIQLEAGDLVETRAFEYAFGVAGMNTEAVEACSLGIGMEGDFIDFMQSEFLDLHSDPAGAGFLQRDFHFELIGLGALPFGCDRLS